MYDCIEVAWQTLKEARKLGIHLSNQRLQKIVYISHGYFLALFNSPLVSDNVERFKYGPCFPKIYQLFSEYVDKEIPVSDSIETDLRFDTNASYVINYVLNLYGNLDYNKLVALTTGELSPSKKYFKEQSEHLITIENDVIKNHYRKVISDIYYAGSL